MKSIEENNKELIVLCNSVRKFCKTEEYEKCYKMICKAMGDYPDSPEPHNLLGLVLEQTGNHTDAMKHFRAAWALDPTYKPANQNLQTYGTFFSNGKCAYDESDVLKGDEQIAEIIYDEKGIGHIGSKNEIIYDKNGLGHIKRR